MKVSKYFVTLAVAGLFVSSNVSAMPGFSEDAPSTSVDRCVAEVSANADYAGAGSVLHNVETEKRRIAGHKMRIKTQVLSSDGESVIREYATFCAIDRNDDIRNFTIRRSDS
ncbi:MAG: hypothetical protein K0U72_07330 [Gammaproteobacteria bacterium]|nr:hypothetical protein [Gammaproteobacteria bacterium]